MGRYLGIAQHILVLHDRAYLVHSMGRSDHLIVADLEHTLRYRIGKHLDHVKSDY